MKTIEVQSTKNYSQFKSVFGNRFVKKGHVQELVESMEKINLMPYQPVLVTKDMYIIDGQHRIEAAKILGLDVNYSIIPNADLSTIQLLNSHMKQWTLIDFCESYAKTGNPHYIRLLEFVDDYKIPMSLAGQLLYGVNVQAGGGAHTVDLRRGDFEIRNEANAVETMRKLSQLQPFSNAGAWKTREFIRCLVLLYSKGLKHEVFLEQLKKTGKRLQRQASSREYIFHILDIYNFGLKKNRLDVYEPTLHE